MIEFGNADSIWWEGSTDTACLFVKTQGRKVLCKVSAEAIDDHFGNATNDSARLDAAILHFDQITDVIGWKIVHNSFETDGSILVRSADL